jgi:hypothetical protein
MSSMSMKFPGVLLAALALLGAAPPASAHHQFGVEFDASRCTDLKGTLTGVDWENPHAYVHLDVKDADGQTHNWGLEMVTPNALKRNGTTRLDFLNNVGKPIAVRACPTKSGGTPYKGSAEYLAFADGIVRGCGQLVEHNLTPEQRHF